MIPENRLSTVPVPGQIFISNPQPSLTESREWGGIALNDPSQGLRVKEWTCVIVGDNIQIGAVGVPFVTVFTAPDTTEVSLAFDQNMRPFVAFVQAGQAKFYWYDSLLEQPVITNLPVGSTSPRATLDDHSPLQTGTSDIILVYLLNGNLYFRQERDRYLTQRLLYADVNLVLVAPSIQYITMNDRNRLQIVLKGAFHGQN